MPLLLERTPYGVGTFSSLTQQERYLELADDSYFFVFQDIRQGTCVMQRPT